MIVFYIDSDVNIIMAFEHLDVIVAEVLYVMWFNDVGALRFLFIDDINAPTSRRETQTREFLDSLRFKIGIRPLDFYPCGQAIQCVGYIGYTINDLVRMFQHNSRRSLPKFGQEFWYVRVFVHRLFGLRCVRSYVS